MIKRQELSLLLKEAAEEIRRLRSENESLKEKLSSMDKVASSIGHDVEHDSHVQQDDSFRVGGFTFGAPEEHVKIASGLSPDEKLDMIFSGEIPPA